MPRNLVSLPESIFGQASRHNYVCLTGRPSGYKLTDGSEHFGRLFRRPPSSLLAIPTDCERWHDDYGIDPGDFLPRGVALHEAAQQNAKALLDPFDDGTPAEWSLVYRLGAWQDGAFLSLVEGKRECSIHIEAGITLVRPTQAEVNQYGGIEAGKVGAA